MTPQQIKAGIDDLVADNARQAETIKSLRLLLDESVGKHAALHGHANRNADRIIAALKILQGDTRSHAAASFAISDAIKALKGESCP